MHLDIKQIERLPFPYNTNCTDYLKLWEQNNGTGPLNQDSCIEYCKLSRLRSNGWCVDEFTTYEPHTEKICFGNLESTTGDISKNCSDICQPACLEYEYDVKYEEAYMETNNVEEFRFSPSNTGLAQN
nr:uncharacterized protein LOC107449928 [Parasteatoda tepidariorum]